MPVQFCIPVIPSADLDKSLRFWIDGLEFAAEKQMYQEGRLINCMLQKGNMRLMLNQRVGNVVEPEDYHGIRLYWAPTEIQETRERLKKLGYGVSEIEDREYGQTEFFLTDDDGFSHCFGVDTAEMKSRMEPQ